MLEQAITNIQWAVALNIAASLLNLLGMALLVVAARRMRKTAQLLRDTAERYVCTTTYVGHPFPESMRS